MSHYNYDHLPVNYCIPGFISVKALFNSCVMQRPTWQIHGLTQCVLRSHLASFPIHGAEGSTLTSLSTGNNTCAWVRINSTRQGQLYMRSCVLAIVLKSEITKCVCVCVLGGWGRVRGDWLSAFASRVKWDRRISSPTDFESTTKILNPQSNFFIWVFLVQLINNDHGATGVRMCMHTQ